MATGLHLADVEQLPGLLDRLVDSDLVAARSTLTREHLAAYVGA